MKLVALCFSVLGGLPLAAQIYADISVEIPQTAGGTSTETIRVELDYVNAPQTVANFMTLAEGTRPWVNSTTGAVALDTPYYDGIIFHRVISGFMIQTGSQKGDGSDGPGYNFPDEVDNGLLHDTGYKISMANSGPHTNGSQFFITHAATSFLDGVHTVFGEVETGTATVDSIATASKDASDKPLTDIVIKSVTIERVGAAANNFDPLAQDLPVVSPLCVDSFAPASPGAAAIMNVTQPAGTTANFSFSEDLSTWTAEKRHLSPTVPAETTYPSSLTSLKGFSAPSLTDWGAEASFPSDLSDKIITLNTNAGVITIDYAAETVNYNGGTGTLDSISVSTDGYGSNILFFSSNVLPIRVRLGANLPHDATYTGRLTGTAYVSTGNISLTGTFTLN